MCSCKITQQQNSRNKTSHFLGESQITQPVEKKELVLRQPTLNKLKVIKPQIIKAEMNKDESTFAEKMDELHQEIFADKNKDDSKQDAEIIEDKKPYNKFDMIMLWLAVLAGCTLVWCSVWFIGRTLLK